MKKPIILIVNGPNLNLLGIRQPEIYGTVTMDEILKDLKKDFRDVKILYFQSNHEGLLIDRIHSAQYGLDCLGDNYPEEFFELMVDKADAIVLNAGGFTHTSVALRDAVASVTIPVIEVHLSDISNREEFRRHSYLTDVCRATIAGLGPAVYDAGVSKALELLEKER